MRAAALLILLVSQLPLAPVKVSRVASEKKTQNSDFSHFTVHTDVIALFS